MNAAKIIWTMWYQGYETAPEIVKLCLQSWHRFNPDWKIIELDRHSLENYLDAATIDYFSRKDLTVQAISNIVRLCLLRKYGGVWVDATVFCCKPLNAWLPAYFSSGFFAFQNPGPDRLLSTWLIAADAKNIILRKLHEEYLLFWRDNYFLNQNKTFGRKTVKKLSRLVNKHPRGTLFWFSFVPRKILRVYPYFIFHYVFNKIVLRDEDCRKAWQYALPFAADLPHRLQFFERREGGLQAAMDVIISGQSPVFKLQLRANTTDSYWSQVLARLSTLLSSRKSDQIDLGMVQGKPTDHSPRI